MIGVTIGMTDQEKIEELQHRIAHLENMVAVLLEPDPEMRTGFVADSRRLQQGERFQWLDSDGHSIPVLRVVR